MNRPFVALDRETGTVQDSGRRRERSRTGSRRGAMHAETREIELDRRRISYTLRRSDRARWLRAELGLRTGLLVTLPAEMEESAIAPFLHARRRWILRLLKRFERLSAIVP